MRPTAATPSPTVLAQNESVEKPAEVSKDIVHIKQQLGELRHVRSPLVIRPWFLTLQAIAPLAWIGTVVRRKRKENLAANPHLVRKRETHRAVARALEDLKLHASANEPDKFFATIFRILQEQIGERLNLPAASITESVAEENLKPRGVDAETIQLVQELFLASNQARYAGTRSSQEMNSLIPKVNEAARRLREMP